MSIVAGVNLIKGPSDLRDQCILELKSKTGRVIALDERADGFLKSEACCAIFLSTTQFAKNKGLDTLAYVCGTSVMNMGNSSSFSAPSGSAFTKVMEQSLQSAKVPRKT